MDEKTKQILRESEASLRASEHMLQLLAEQNLTETQDSYVQTVMTSILAVRKNIGVLVPPPPPSHTVRQPPLSVLIADDDAVQRMWVSRTLEQAGFEIGCAANGPDVVRAANERRWDVILMDCEIPVIDGFEVTRLIKDSRSSASKASPIVAYSSYGIAGYKQRCLQVGMSSFLPKPASKEDLISCLMRAASERPTG